MSGADQERMRFEEMGLSHVREAYVCSNHIDDYAIKGFIKRTALAGTCSYCKKNKKVVLLEELMFFIMEGLLRFYQDAAEFMGYDSRQGGYLGTTYSAGELINDLAQLDTDNDELNDDIVNSIEERAWADDAEYYDKENDILNYHWDYFKDTVKHKARFLFAQTNKFKTYEYNENAYDILHDVARNVRKYKLITTIPANTNLFRIRQHERSEKIDEVSKMASPPIDKAVYANRMSPAGISMFYCALDMETAKLETIDENKKGYPYFTTSIFTPKTGIKVIDFSRLPRVPSLFDKKGYKSFYTKVFLHSFVRDLSAGIQRDGMEHIDYVPTQIITEYFRYVFKNREAVNGIVYPSSKKKGAKSCVLFFNHEESLKNLNLKKASLKTMSVKKGF